MALSMSGNRVGKTWQRTLEAWLWEEYSSTMTGLRQSMAGNRGVCKKTDPSGELATDADWMLATTLYERLRCGLRVMDACFAGLLGVFPRAD